MVLAPPWALKAQHGKEGADNQTRHAGAPRTQNSAPFSHSNPSLPYGAQHTTDLVLQKIPVVQKYKSNKIFLIANPPRPFAESVTHEDFCKQTGPFHAYTHGRVQHLLKSIAGILMYIFLCFASPHQPQICLGMFPRNSTSEGILFISFAGW